MSELAPDTGPARPPSRRRAAPALRYNTALEKGRALVLPASTLNDAFKPALPAEGVPLNAQTSFPMPGALRPTNPT